jgi:hypothetical protein
MFHGSPRCEAAVADWFTIPLCRAAKRLNPADPPPLVPAAAGSAAACFSASAGAVAKAALGMRLPTCSSPAARRP